MSTQVETYPRLHPAELAALEKEAGRKFKDDAEAHAFRKEKLLADAAEYFLSKTSEQRRQLVQEIE